MPSLTFSKRHERDASSSNSNTKRKPRATLAASDRILTLDSPYILFRNPAVFGDAIAIRNSIDGKLHDTIRETMGDLSFPPDAADALARCLFEVLQKELAHHARNFACEFASAVLQNPADAARQTIRAGSEELGELSDSEAAMVTRLIAQAAQADGDSVETLTQFLCHPEACVPQSRDLADYAALPSPKRMHAEKQILQMLLSAFIDRLVPASREETQDFVDAPRMLSF